MGCLSFFVIVAFVAAAVAIDRTMKARQRLDDLGARVATLEGALEQLSRRLSSISPPRTATAPPPLPAPAPAPAPPAAGSLQRQIPPREMPLQAPAPPAIRDAAPPVTPSPPHPPEHKRIPPVAPAPAGGGDEERAPDTPGPGLLARLDFERLVGVRMFSAVAGLALVVAAVLFLRYSIDQGWLGPPIRFAIGLFVGVGLLVLCEQRAARRYAVTANALDAAAVAVLFSTFYAAHALWDLVPALPTFGFLALVAALAVILSIRRDSQFIAVLGLLGGFATPAMLSTGENQPVQLFSYLLLLNVGLAWVAYRKAWPLLSWLTLGLTTIYQC